MGNALLDTVRQRQASEEAERAAADSGRRAEALATYRRILGQGEPGDSENVAAFCAACNTLGVTTADVASDIEAIERAVTHTANIKGAREARASLEGLRAASKAAERALEESVSRFRRAYAAASGESMSADALRKIAKQHPRVFIMGGDGLPALHPDVAPISPEPSTPEPATSTDTAPGEAPAETEQAPEQSDPFEAFAEPIPPPSTPPRGRPPKRR